MLAAAVIVVSLIVQGLTLEPLVRRAGITRPDAARHEETPARLRLAEAALARLDELAAGDCAADDVIDRARASLQARIGHSRARIDGAQAPEPDGLTDRDLRRDLNAAENAELARLYDDGTISQATGQQLQRGLDLEAARLSYEEVSTLSGDCRQEVLRRLESAGRTRSLVLIRRPGTTVPMARLPSRKS